MRHLFLCAVLILLVPTGAGSHTIKPCTCDTDCYTDQVRDLVCSPDKARFRSDGLPDPSHEMMLGIKASNQQFPSQHNLEIEIPRNPQFRTTPTPTEAGAIGVAVNGVPLFNPDTQGPPGAGGKPHSAYDAGELDTCGGHAGRGDDYHYHIAPKCLIQDLGTAHVEKDKKPIGYAMDGFPILALGWFEKSNDVERLLDPCRGMRDAEDRYFYNVMHRPKWDILNCFHGRPQHSARDHWRRRMDKNNNEIVGLPIRFEIEAYQTATDGSDVCHTMTGQLSNEQLLQTNGQTRRITRQGGSIFHCNSGCYGLFFEADRKPQFRGRVLYYDLVTERCPGRFDLSELKPFDAYRGPPQTPKGPPPTGKGPPRDSKRPPPRDGEAPPPRN